MIAHEPARRGRSTDARGPQRQVRMRVDSRRAHTCAVAPATFTRSFAFLQRRDIATPTPFHSRASTRLCVKPADP